MILRKEDQMTITTTLQNLSAEASASVNIKPHPNTWVETNYESSGSNQVATCKQVGDDISYPLVRRVFVNKAQVFHPDHPTDKRNGIRRTISLHTTNKIEDSVSGLITYEPLEVYISVAHGGTQLDDLADVVQFLLSAVSEFYDSVTTGTPDTSVMAKLSLGSSRLD